MRWWNPSATIKAAAVTAALAPVLLPYPGSCYTTTFDDGKKFLGHASVAVALQVDKHFVHP